MSDSTWNVITDSLGLLRNAATLISDANANAPTPCSAWTVAQVFQHAVGDQLAWAAAIGEGTGPAEDPFTPSGLLKGSAAELIEPALATARIAWAKVRADDDAVPTPLPQGTRPAATAAAACALDAAVHAWDIAVALGRPGGLPGGLAAQLLPAARSIVEPLRQFGAYAPAWPARAEDDHAAELLRYLGRDPQWVSTGLPARQ
jgi:uncharacterized protein (TIGR03086 family)